MIKRLHEIRLRDIILLDATKSARSLMRIPLPVWFFRRKLEKLAKDIFELIGGQTIQSLTDEYEKLMSYRKLQVLEALYKAVQIELGLKPKINAWKLILQKDYKDSPQLEEVLSEVKRITGIDIQTPENLQELTDYIQHKVDKHQEIFKEQETAEPTADLSEVIYSVFNYMNEPHNENMRLIDFVTMKRVAERRAKQQSKQQDNGE